jgi:hypothetical protein
MSIILEDLLGMVPHQILGFLDHEIRLLVSQAEAITGRKIEISAAMSGSMRCVCRRTHDGYAIRIPAEFVTRVALVSEIFRRTRNPSGMRGYIVNEQHGAGFEHLKASSPEDYKALYERARQDLQNLPDEYKCLVGSFDHSLDTVHLEWWLREFKINRYEFVFRRDFREQFRFAILFIVVHELMHIVLSHFDVLDGLDGAPDEKRMQVRRRLEIEADCGGIFALLRFAASRAIAYCDSRKMPRGDPRLSHLYFGSAYDVARGAVLAMAFLDCNKMWSVDFADSIYFPPASRVTFALRAMEPYFQELGGGRFLERSLYREVIDESSWWFRSTSIFQDTEDIFDAEMSSYVGDAVALFAIQEVSSDISDLLMSKLLRRDLRGGTSPFNISMSSKLSPEMHKKMFDCTDGPVLVGDAGYHFADFNDLQQDVDGIQVVHVRYS